MTPIYIFSLPRSGSTLLQRILSNIPEIATISEPWFILPIVYTMREEGIFSEYGHSLSYVGIQDLIATFPNKEKDYYAEINTFAKRLYAKCRMDGERYFLDKTPRYHLICKEMIDIFPEAKFIFLWRNPVSIISSLISTFGKGQWNLYRFYIDLFIGLPNLIETYDPNNISMHAIQYEALITDPVSEVNHLLRFLTIDSKNYGNDVVNLSCLNGRLGDKSGANEYKSISDAPLDKWKSCIHNRFRKNWCRKYLHYLGEERLRVMGYEMNQIQHSIDLVHNTGRYYLHDHFKSLYGILFRYLEPAILRYKWKLLFSNTKGVFHQ